MLVMALAFGLILAGCDDESLFGLKGNPFIGTWEYNSDVYFSFKRDSFTHKNFAETYTGAYSHDGNKATLYLDQGDSYSIQIDNDSFTFDDRKFKKK